MPSSVAVPAGRTKEGKMKVVAKDLGGDARLRVGDRISYLEIDAARPLWERNVLGLDQKAGAWIYIFPGTLELVFSCPHHYCHKWNVIGFPRS